MTNTELNNLTNELADLENQINSLNKQKEELTETIMKQLEEKNLNEFISDKEVRVLIFDKITFKYTNDNQLIEWLEKNKYEIYIEKTINKTKLNAELKKDKPIKLVEDLNKNNMFTKNVTTAFKIVLPKN